MFRSNKFNMILALIVAIVLWSYVLVDVNQSSTETVRGVPITIVNTESLAQNDMIILSADYTKVNIGYSCQRQFLSKVKAEDFTVTADAEGLKIGENKVKLTVTGPDDVNIETMSVQKITITVDERISVEKPVNPVIEGQTSDESEPSILQLSDETITVEGARTLVEQVASLHALLDAEKVGNEMKSLTVPLTAVDADGDEVKNISLSKSNVSVTAIMLKKKTVPLEVPLTGAEHSSFERTVKLPKTITIKGSEDALADIENIQCRVLNLSDVFEDTKIKLEPILPAGVTPAADSQSLYAKVTVKGVETQIFTFSENDVVLQGVSENAVAAVADVEISVSVTAKSDEMSGISAEDFSLSADVEGLGAGEHTVKLSCILSKPYADLECTPNEIHISITESETLTDEQQ